MTANPAQSDSRPNQPTPPTPPSVLSPRSEFWNSVTHAFGFVLSLIAVGVLVSKAQSRPTLTFWTVVVFGVCMICVYLFSTLSHFVTEPKLRTWFRQLDQASIYLLITACYTPFSAAHQDGIWWWGVLVLMWTISIVGFLSKLVFAHQVEGVSIWIYQVLGWIPFISGMPFAGIMPVGCIWAIILGGVFYSAGTVFLILDYKAWYFHPIWHLFVIAGSTVHTIGIYRFVCQ